MDIDGLEVEEMIAGFDATVDKKVLAGKSFGGEVDGEDWDQHEQEVVDKNAFKYTNEDLTDEDVRPNTNLKFSQSEQKEDLQTDLDKKRPPRPMTAL